MHSGCYSHCGFNTITINCPLRGGNKSEGSLEKIKTPENIAL
jgi:hypothetical protein